MRGVVVDGFDLGEGGEVLGFGVEGGSLVGGGGDVSVEGGVRAGVREGEGGECTYCTRTLSWMSHL